MTFPFLGAEISFHQLERYRREFVDLRYLFMMPHYHKWYLFDLASMKDNQVELTPADETIYKDDDFLPSRQFFARSHTEPDEALASVNLTNQKHLLDGTWEPSDLSKLFGRVTDLYSFYLGMRKIRSSGDRPNLQTANIIKAFTEYPFRGGSSYVNFYRDLASALGFPERLAMGAIEKKSPGYVEIAGEPGALGDVVDAMKHFAVNYEELQSQYKAMHSFLSTLDYLSANPDKVRMTKETRVRIREMSDELADGLGLDRRELQKLTGKTLSTAKILMSHYRRLERYYLFFAEGRLRLPGELN